MRGPTPQQMKGLPKDQSVGLIPLSINEIFSFIKNDTARSYKISVSYLEVSLLIFNGYLALQRMHKRFDLLEQ